MYIQGFPIKRKLSIGTSSVPIRLALECRYARVFNLLLSLNTSLRCHVLLLRLFFLPPELSLILPLVLLFGFPVIGTIQGFPFLASQASELGHGSG